MANLTKILMDYTNGRKTLEETNQYLAENGAIFHLDPQKNVITEEERAMTTIDEKTNKVNGYGLMDSGTGSFDKVHIIDGKLEHNIGCMFAYIFVGENVYTVAEDGETLI